MKVYKNLAVALLVIDIIFIAVAGSLALINGCELSIKNLITFDFVAFDFTITQGVWSRITQAITELCNLHPLLSTQYNVLPCCFIVNALMFIVAFVVNVKRWANLLPYAVQIITIPIVLQMLYAVALNSYKDLMLLSIAGVSAGLCAVFYVIALCSFAYIKILNPLRRGFIVIMLGMLSYYKSYLCNLEICNQFSQMFDAVVLVIALEVVIDFLNILERIVKNDQCGERVESPKV